MTSHSRNLALLAVIAAGILPATAARAQSYGAAYAPPPPLYPYVVQQNQPYAIQVSPNTYVIQHPAHTRDHPHARCKNCGNRAAIAAPKKAAPRFDRPHKPVDHALVEELRKRSHSKDTVNTTKIVREAPVIVETKRYVDDPPRVIERRHVVEDAPAQSRRGLMTNDDVDAGQAASRDDGKKRVIRAEAEVTIIGPDRMNIRLFRQRHGPNAKAPAED
jgi:hypothetical protein